MERENSVTDCFTVSWTICAAACSLTSSSRRKYRDLARDIHSSYSHSLVYAFQYDNDRIMGDRKA